MGSGQSSLDELEFGEALPTTSNIHKIWTSVSPARYEKNQNVTVFVKNFNEKETSEETKKFYENGIKTLKLLRHPNILKFYNSFYSTDEMTLVVERVRPLDHCLNDVDVCFETEEILCGLQNIFDAVKFLHENAKLSHNNIGILSIFICPDHNWKLGSFEFSMQPVGGSHWCQSDFVKSVKELHFVPPEDQKVLQVKAPWHARDVYGLGKLAERILPLISEKIDDAQVQEIDQCIQQMCDSDATKRPQLKFVDYCAIFRNALSDITSKLRNIPLMSLSEKEIFFNHLLAQLRTLSPSLLARKLTKSLLSRYVLIENWAVTNCLTTFLTPKRLETDDGLLSIVLYQKYVVPELKKIFCVHEKLVRLNLLSVFDRYVNVFDKKTLQDLILPELLLGMKDIDQSIVASSMKCLACLVPILGPSTVTGFVQKKYFSDGRPRESLTASVEDVPHLTSVQTAMALDSKDISTANDASRESKREKIRRATEERRKELDEKRKSKQNLISSKKIELEKDEFEENPAEALEEKKMNESETFTSTNERRSSSDWSDWEAEGRLEIVDDAQVSLESQVSDKIQELDQQSSPSVDILTRFAGLTESKEKPLGSEFDVLGLEICSGEDEMDNLFVDMAPVVRKPLTSSVKIPSKFDVASLSNEPEVSGWSDNETD